MNTTLYEIRNLIDEIEALEEELNYMCEAWDGDDPYEAASSDPGLQFEKEEEIAEKYRELRETYNIKVGE